MSINTHSFQYVTETMEDRINESITAMQKIIGDNYDNLHK